jgi:hypothetical protein
MESSWAFFAHVVAQLVEFFRPDGVGKEIGDFNHRYAI